MASGDYMQKNSKCRPKNPCQLIRKLVDLMDHPVSQNSTGRHLQLLNDFLNASHYAFWLRDIPYIIRLYDMITRAQDKQFKEPLECLLYFSAVPPMMTKPSESLEFARDLQEFFSTLGFLIICLRDKNLSSLVLKAIIGLLDQKNPVGYCCVPLDSLREAAEKSKLPEILTQVLQVISDELYPLLLEAMLLVCKISEVACRKMLEENAIEFLLQRLDPTWKRRNKVLKPNNPKEEDVICCIEDRCNILLRLLCSIDKIKNANIPKPTILALWSLRYAFRWSLINYNHRVDRNTLTAIILKLLHIFPNMELQESGLADDIAVCATSAAEYCCRMDVKFVNDEIDFQFRKLLWATLFYFKKHNADEALLHNNVLNALLKYLVHDTGIKEYIHQHCTFIKIVLKLLPKIFVADSIETFLNRKGVLILTKMVNSYVEATYNSELLEACLGCIEFFLALEVEEVTITMEEYGIFPTIKSLCKKILNFESLSTIHQKCLAHIFSILQTMSKKDYANYHITVNLCVEYLNREVNPNKDDPVFDHRVTINALHLLWNDIMAVQSVWAEFLENGGIYTILDIMEHSTFPVKCETLGILSDMCKKSSCVPYLITWRKRGLKLIPLLMEIFRGETEKFCAIPGKIKFRPRYNDNKYVKMCEGNITTFQDHCVTPPEILRCSRWRIYTIIHALKVNFKDKVDIANQYYRLYSERLETDDQLTMLFAENFLSLTMCQTWMVIAKELKSVGVVPVKDDHELLSDKIVRIRQWKEYLQYKIERIVGEEVYNDTYTEMDTYMQMNESRLTDALEALKELRYVSNCTERMFNVRKKLRLSLELESTRKYNEKFHRTITDLPFINIFGQYVSIQSDVVHKVNKDESDLLPPVSPLRENEDKFEIIYTDEILHEPLLEC